MLMNRWNYFEDTGGGSSNGLLTDLSAYYALDSDATDEHSTNDGTATNVTWNTTTYLLGTASGEGAGADTARVDIPKTVISDTGDLSISAWFYPDDSHATFGYLWVRESTATMRACGVRLVNGNVEFLNSNNTAWINAGSFTVGAWNHIVLTYSSTSGYSCYLDNGTPVTDSGTTTTTGSVNAFGIIGRGNGNTSKSLDGKMDGVAIYDGRVLDATDVSNLYNSGSGLPYSSFTT